MKVIELWDAHEHVFLTLLQVLTALPSRAHEAEWVVSDFADAHGLEVFEVGYGDEGISRLANTGRRVNGRALISLASSSAQIIRGTFQGYDPDDRAEPWIRLHAMDSTFWRCETDDIIARQALMTTFDAVRLVER